MLISGSEDVDDAAANSELTSSLDKVNPLVAQINKTLDEIFERDLIT